MYPNVYDHQKVEVSITQILMAVIVVMVALVLPAQYLMTQQPAAIEEALSTTSLQTAESTSTEGRVAGATTSERNLFTVPILNITIDLNDQSQLLYLVGGGLIVFSIILFVIATEPKKQEQKLPPHWR